MIQLWIFITSLMSHPHSHRSAVTRVTFNEEAHLSRVYLVELERQVGRKKIISTTVENYNSRACIVQ